MTDDLLAGPHRVAVFLAATGEIVRVVAMTDVRAMAIQCGPGEEWIPVADDVRDGTHMVEAARAVPRPALLQLPDTIVGRVGDVLTVDELPAGTVVRWQERGVEIDANGRGAFVPILPGVTSLQIRPPFPWRPATITVSVDEPL